MRTYVHCTWCYRCFFFILSEKESENRKIAYNVGTFCSPNLFCLFCPCLFSDGVTLRNRVHQQQIKKWRNQNHSSGRTSWIPNRSHLNSFWILFSPLTMIHPITEASIFISFHTHIHTYGWMKRKPSLPILLLIHHKVLFTMWHFIRVSHFLFSLHCCYCLLLLYIFIILMSICMRLLSIIQIKNDKRTKHSLLHT